jgi:plastocyanin domain-containing protein
MITIKKNTINIIIGVVLVIVLLSIVFLGNGNNNAVVADTKPIVIENGKQILTMNARGGYTPDSFQAQANIDSVLRIVTQNNFDCSSSITIPALKVRRTLPPTGSTEIELGSQPSGTTINGSCSMGMYRFVIKFT